MLKLKISSLVQSLPRQECFCHRTAKTFYSKPRNPFRCFVATKMLNKNNNNTTRERESSMRKNKKKKMKKVFSSVVHRFCGGHKEKTSYEGVRVLGLGNFVACIAPFRALFFVVLRLYRKKPTQARAKSYVLKVRATTHDNDTLLRRWDKMVMRLSQMSYSLSIF